MQALFADRGLRSVEQEVHHIFKCQLLLGARLPVPVFSLAVLYAPFT
ncbi:MAG: hypothetical protein QG595_1591, partial [Pseudomonadota bacterium]|nr:hypothetical protein [Pseudomonadota bacterium]